MFNVNKLKSLIVLNGLSQKEFAEKIGMNEATLYRKMKADGNFLRCEIDTILTVLKINDPTEIFFCERTCVKARQ